MQKAPEKYQVARLTMRDPHRQPMMSKNNEKSLPLVMGHKSLICHMQRGCLGSSHYILILGSQVENG